MADNNIADNRIADLRRSLENQYLERAIQPLRSHSVLDGLKKEFKEDVKVYIIKKIKECYPAVTEKATISKGQSLDKSMLFGTEEGAKIVDEFIASIQADYERIKPESLVERYGERTAAQIYEVEKDQAVNAAFAACFDELHAQPFANMNPTRLNFFLSALLERALPGCEDPIDFTAHLTISGIRDLHQLMEQMNLLEDFDDIAKKENWAFHLAFYLVEQSEKSQRLLKAYADCNGHKPTTSIENTSSKTWHDVYSLMRFLIHREAYEASNNVAYSLSVLLQRHEGGDLKLELLTNLAAKFVPEAFTEAVVIHFERSGISLNIFETLTKVLSDSDLGRILSNVTDLADEEDIIEYTEKYGGDPELILAKREIRYGEFANGGSTVFSHEVILQAADEMSYAENPRKILNFLNRHLDQTSAVCTPK